MTFISPHTVTAFYCPSRIEDEIGPWVFLLVMGALMFTEFGCLLPFFSISSESHCLLLFLKLISLTPSTSFQELRAIVLAFCSDLFCFCIRKSPFEPCGCVPQEELF